jgi:hypothetical protein
LNRLRQRIQASRFKSRSIKSDPPDFLDLPDLLGIQDQPDLLELTQRFQALWDRLAPMELTQLFQDLLAHRVIQVHKVHKDPLGPLELIQLFQDLLDLLDPKEIPVTLDRLAPIQLFLAHKVHKDPREPQALRALKVIQAT